MPVLGFGVYQVTDLEECERSVSDALSTGYRLIDTASAYGNETAVGKAIKKSGIKREDIFLTTKLWVQDAGEGKTRNAFNKSLKNLGLEYIDLYLIHQPYGDIYGAWRDMEALLKEGLVRAIGVSNFESDRLIDLILHNEVKPAVNQIETHPFNQQIAAHDFMKENDVQQESWGPFAEGKHDIFTNALLAGIGKKYNKSVAQVILRWLIQRSIVVIPKSVKKERIEQNFDVFDFSLSGEDMDQIVSLDLKTSSFFDHRDPDMVKWLGTRKLT